MEGETPEGIATIGFLDCARLRLRRKEVIEKYIYGEERNIDELIADVSESFAGYPLAFCMAILYVLKKCGMHN